MNSRYLLYCICIMGIFLMVRLLFDSNGVTIKYPLANVGAQVMLIHICKSRSCIIGGSITAGANVALCCTSGITDMSQLFSGRNSFNKNIGGWDTASVTTMRKMFRNAHQFNQNLNNWDVSNVEDMHEMFFKATTFDSPIGSWNTSKVEDMSYMFCNADDFNQFVGDWDTSKVINMSRMFFSIKVFNNGESAGSFTSSLNWDVSKVTNMGAMFNDDRDFNADIRSWNTGENTQMFRMFRLTQNFNQDLSNWDVSNVRDMEESFKDASAFSNGGNGTLCWNTEKVTTMAQMFRNADLFNSDISCWNTSKVEDISLMFYQNNSFNNGGVAMCWDDGFATTGTTAEQMFYQATAINEDLSCWDTSNIVTMTQMFVGANSFNNGGVAMCWDDGFGPNATMKQMFQSNNAINQDLSCWDTSNVVNMQEMFEFTSFNNGGVALNWDDGFGLNASLLQIFRECSFNQDISSWDTSNVQNMGQMFDRNYVFNNGQGAGQSTASLNTWDTSNVTSMGAMFWRAGSFNQDIGEWDVRNVSLANFGSMFNLGAGAGPNIMSFDSDI